MGRGEEAGALDVGGQGAVWLDHLPRVRAGVELRARERAFEPGAVLERDLVRDRTVARCAWRDAEFADPERQADGAGVRHSPGVEDVQGAIDGGSTHRRRQAVCATDQARRQVGVRREDGVRVAQGGLRPGSGAEGGALKARFDIDRVGGVDRPQRGCRPAVERHEVACPKGWSVEKDRVRFVHQVVADDDGFLAKVPAERLKAQVVDAPETQVGDADAEPKGWEGTLEGRIGQAEEDRCSGHAGRPTAQVAIPSASPSKRSGR